MIQQYRQLKIEEGMLQFRYELCDHKILLKSTIL